MRNTSRKGEDIITKISCVIGYTDRKEQKMRIVVEEGCILPTKAHKADAGLDLYSNEDKYIRGHDAVVFDTGIHVQIPQGYAGLLVSKSGLNVNHDITNTGLIDSGYTGSIKVKLYNHLGTPYKVKKGDKISQLVIIPIWEYELEIVDSLEQTERGDGGFGSTGR